MVLQRGGVTPILVSVVEARDLPLRDDENKTDAFVVIEAGGVRHQTEVVRCSDSPVWDHMCTMRAVFGGGVREELTVQVWHQEVNT